IAGNRGRHVNLRRLACKRFLKRDFHIVTQVSATFLTAGAALPPAHDISENIFENIGKTTALPKPAATGTHAAILESRMAETVIGRTLLRIAQRFIGLIDLLKLVLSIGIALIAIR